MSVDADVPSSREVEDLLHPHRKLLARLRRSDAFTRGDLDATLHQLTELAVQLLRVERASVWRLTSGGLRLECLDLFRRSTGTHERMSAIESQSAVAYFAALETERCIVARDVFTDPRTSALAPYLEAHRIGAMLDAPIFAHGEMVGVVCHEHVGGPRQWQLWEELVAGTMADFVALVMEAEERHRAQAEAERYRRSLEEEAALRRVFEAAPAPLVMARADGVIELFNPRAIEIIGIPPEAALSGTITSERFYAHPEERQRLLAEVREKGFVDNREILMKSWSGDERWCLASLRTVTYRGAPHVVMGFSEIQAQKEVEARLRDAAIRDPLTGIYNRRQFFEVAAAELERSRRYGRPFSVAILDADHFKEKNDRYGHLVGDELLVSFASKTAGELRQSDLAARYGGEELIVLLPETDLDAAFAVTERIRKRVGENAHPTATAGPVELTCSAGVVAWNGEEPLPKMIDRADRALYVAKSKGRDRVERG